MLTFLLCNLEFKKIWLVSFLQVKVRRIVLHVFASSRKELEDILISLSAQCNAGVWFKSYANFPNLCNFNQAPCLQTVPCAVECRPQSDRSRRWTRSRTWGCPWSRRTSAAVLEWTSPGNFVYFFLGRITKSAYHPLIIGNEQLCIGLANFVVIPQHFDAQRTPRHVLECACIQSANSHRGKGV